MRVDSENETGEIHRESHQSESSMGIITRWQGSQMAEMRWDTLPQG